MILEHPEDEVDDFVEGGGGGGGFEVFVAEDEGVEGFGFVEGGEAFEEGEFLFVGPGGGVFEEDF